MDHRIDLTENFDFAETRDSPPEYIGLVDMRTLRQIQGDIDQDEIWRIMRDSNEVFCGDVNERLGKVANALYGCLPTCERCGKSFARIPFHRVDSIGLCQTCYEDMIFGQPLWMRIGWEGEISEAILEMLRETSLRSARHGPNYSPRRFPEGFR